MVIHRRVLRRALLGEPSPHVRPLVTRVSFSLLAATACACATQDPSDSGADEHGGFDSEADGGGADLGVDVGVSMPPRLDSVTPALGDPLGGARLTLRGDHLAGAVVEIGGEPCVVEVGDATELRCQAPALAVGVHDVEVTTADGVDVAESGYEAWSPAALPGARVFDARVGVDVGAASTHYEWQRLTPEISASWRVRDGNTLTWLPSTGKFWMVGGWNGLEQPEGFSEVDPSLGIYPPQNTTDEVWSSVDGVSWTLELPHQHGQFERRHVHVSVSWNDAIWMIGGDAHQGYYNHDVVRSEDGVEWEEVLAPGEPPWSPRALQISGVYQGALWTGGGQDLLGSEAEYAYHNDLWRSEDGVQWTQVVGDAPSSDTRWAGCGMVDGFVEFKGRMWLVGCARYGEVVGHEIFAEVWSTTDGITWQRHADPPWSGKSWHNVVVWDDKLWLLFGGANSGEVWFSADGESWEMLPADYPAPGSHAQGVAVHEDYLLYAGGNYSFGFGAGIDKSAWRLVAFRGSAVTTWTDRGQDALVAAAVEEADRPVLVADAFADGEPGLHFDGSRSLLSLVDDDEQPDGRTVMWVARAPYLPVPYGFEETYAPVASLLGGPDGSGFPNSSIGLSEGSLVMVNREVAVGPNGEPTWTRVVAGNGLQEGPGEVHFVGLTHATDGSVEAWVDGERVTASASASYATPRSWRHIGGSLEGNYYGPNSRFAGTVGAVIILPGVVDDATVERIHQWSQGRFGVP